MSKESESMHALEDWLKEEASDLLRAPSPENGHIETAVLVAAGAGKSLDAATKAHLLECEECRAVLGGLLEAPPPHRAQRWLGQLLAPRALALAATVTAGLLFVTLPERPPEYSGKGAATSRFEAASVTVLHDDPGSRRVLVEGDEVPIGARLGFRYGNPTGEAKTITILGWDRRRVHWYYPETADGAPQPLRSGSDVVAERLPFDVLLDGAHRAGRLELWMGFDVAPAALATRAKSGRPPTSKMRRLTFNLVEAAK